MRALKISILMTMMMVSNYTYKVQGQHQKSVEFEMLKEKIQQKMSKHNLHGLSVAVFEDYKVIWNHEWGIKSADSNEKIDQNTAFSTASTSKAVVAILCGILEEKGLINLNDPISGYLKRWHLPKSDFTQNTQVNWLHLLSHTAGTTQGGFADFYEGDNIPTIVQSLKGELLPRYDKEIDFMFTPGTDWEYSGGGYVIIQMALEDHFGKPLSELMKEHVFLPLGLKNTTMKQPNEKGFLTNVAKVHNSKGEVIRTGLPITPQVAPSGLWSTPSDLSKIAIEVQNALRNTNNKVISNAVAKRITKVVTLKKTGGWSAGWRRSFGFANRDWFSHGGSNTGVGGEFMATMNGGYGIAIQANGDKPNRIPVMSFLRNEIMTIRDWNLPIDTSVLKKAPTHLIKAIEGPYLDFLYSTQGINRISEEDGNLFISSPLFKYLQNSEKNAMYYIGNNTFKVDQYPNYLQFNLDDTNELLSITVFREQSKKNKIVIKKEDIRNHKTQLIDVFSENSIAVAIQEYKRIKKEKPDLNYERILNEFGYLFYIQNKTKKAVEVLEFNCQEHPESFNTYDSLGEIYEITGSFNKSIENYKKAMAINVSHNYQKRVKQKIQELESKMK